MNNDSGFLKLASGLIDEVRNELGLSDDARQRKVLSRNIAECLKCGDVVESTHVHDFKYCSCGAMAVDGGLEYVRRVGEPGDIEEMSEYAVIVQ